jgi:hypothetical protein
VSDADEDVLQIFLKERELNGDFVSRTCDLLWQMNARNSSDYDVSKFTDNNSQQIEQVQFTHCTEFQTNLIQFYNILRGSFGNSLPCANQLWVLYMVSLIKQFSFMSFF